MKTNINLDGRMIGVAWYRVGYRYVYIYRVSIHAVDGVTTREALVALLNKLRGYGDLWIRIAEDDPLRKAVETMGLKKAGVSVVMARPVTSFKIESSGLVFNRLAPGQGEKLARLYSKIFVDSFSPSLSRLYRPLTREEAEALLVDNHNEGIYSS